MHLHLHSSFSPPSHDTNRIRQEGGWVGKEKGRRERRKKSGRGSPRLFMHAFHGDRRRGTGSLPKTPWAFDHSSCVPLRYAGRKKQKKALRFSSSLPHLSIFCERSSSLVHDKVSLSCARWFGTDVVLFRKGEWEICLSIYSAIV